MNLAPSLLLADTSSHSAPPTAMPAPTRMRVSARPSLGTCLSPDAGQMSYGPKRKLHTQSVARSQLGIDAPRVAMREKRSSASAWSVTTIAWPAKDIPPAAESTIAFATKRSPETSGHSRLLRRANRWLDASCLDADSDRADTSARTVEIGRQRKSGADGAGACLQAYCHGLALSPMG
jgi:hypothetical protein